MVKVIQNSIMFYFIYKVIKTIIIIKIFNGNIVYNIKKIENK